MQAVAQPESTYNDEAALPGTRLTEILKEAKIVASDSRHTHKSGYRRNDGHQRGTGACKPLKEIANAGGPPSAAQAACHGFEALVPGSEPTAVAKDGSSTANAGKAHASSGPKRAIRDGGHENFVRCTMKKGKSSFKYKSKSGCSNRNPKNRRWAMKKMAAESLPVAGLGADNANEASLV